MAYRVRYNNKHHRNKPVISKPKVEEIDTAAFEVFCEELKRIKSEREAKKHRRKKKTE